MSFIYFFLFLVQSIINSEHNTVLRTFVSKDGLVDYTRLANNKKMLNVLVDELKNKKLKFQNEKQEMVFLG